ncbi:uncharacterized protein MAM_07989 [Metarhizium album ARSEF 1941]|uniref:AA1-like domain-containing protein n=1 Tax=Metarhizium album (strain ARSEF 1941) TaxID=1081103 RepID=A0A0B2WKF6_METAS|nr:uncharacterized protein MAM_07989 [Metarhizium album ARSEF 1941]KHN94149.1 hypothetical protein MAM_07989 [Metarhizium album ARSEF 1941]
MRPTLFLLAALPAATLARLAYTPPAALAVKADDPNNDCVLPADYHVRNFTAATNTTGGNSSRSLTSYRFTFLNTLTNSSTSCAYGPGTKPQASASKGGLPRYSCESTDVSFIWQDETKKLSMIQKVCPDANGQADYEAAGSVIISLSCSLDACRTNATDYRGTFTSLNPIEHPRAVRHERGVVWSVEVAG